MEIITSDAFNGIAIIEGVIKETGTFEIISTYHIVLR